MPTKDQPVSITDIATSITDESNKLTTSNAVYDFVKQEISKAITTAIESGY